MFLNIYYISFGNNIYSLTNKSIESLVKNIDKEIYYKINVITDSFDYISHKYSINQITPNILDLLNNDNVHNSRFYKTQLNTFCNHDSINLYLDSDTEIMSKDILNILSILEDGFDLVISPSNNQGKESFWHIHKNEKEYTYSSLGYEPLQLQGGMIAWKNNEHTDSFFRNWHDEWLKFKDQDQAALVRALDKSPVKYYLVSNVFNGGSVVKHKFGSTKSR